MQKIEDGEIVQRLAPLREDYDKALAQLSKAMDVRRKRVAKVLEVLGEVRLGEVITVEGVGYVVADRCGTPRIPDVLRLTSVSGHKVQRIRLGRVSHDLGQDASLAIGLYYNAVDVCFSCRTCVHQARTALRHEVETALPPGTKAKVVIGGVVRRAEVKGYDDRKPSFVRLMIAFDDCHQMMTKDVTSNRLNIQTTHVPP